jgi:hypothetical protein
MARQNGLKHEWRDLTDDEICTNNSEVKRDASGIIDRNEMPSWTYTRVCKRCGLYAPDFLQPEQSSCDLLVIQGIHES